MDFISNINQKDIENEQIECTIKDNQLIFSINYNKFSKYLQYFKDIENIDSDDVNNISHILYFISIMNSNNKLYNILKSFDYYLGKEEFIIDYLDSIKISKLFKVYNELNDLPYIQNILKKYFNDKFFNIKYSRNDLKSKFEICIKYNLKTINFCTDLLNNLNYTPLLQKKLENIYLKQTCNLIKKDLLCDDHIIFNIQFFEKFIYEIYKFIFDDDVLKIKNDNYINSFKIIIKNNLQFTIIYILKNINNKYYFDYIFDIYKNNINDILANINNNYYIDFIRNDICKNQIIQYYINCKKTTIDCYDIIEFLIKDEKISIQNIKDLITLKILNINNNIDLLDLHKTFNDIMNKEVLQSDRNRDIKSHFNKMIKNTYKLKF